MKDMNNLVAGRIAEKQMYLQDILALQERHEKNNNILQVTILQSQLPLIKSEITFLQSILILEKEANNAR